jgi:hypothetical protein
MGKAKTDRPLEQVAKPIDSYSVAYQTRNFEIQLFWQRSNYFLVLNTGIITGIAIKLNSTDPIAAIFIVFGFFVSLLWFRVNLGSKFWQSRWEQRLYDIEERISPNANLFSATDEQIKADVEKSMQIAGGRNWWRRYIDRKALLKPSVSRQMILLSVGFICLYIAFSIVWIIRILSGSTA